MSELIERHLSELRQKMFNFESELACIKSGGNGNGGSDLSRIDILERNYFSFTRQVLDLISQVSAVNARIEERQDEQENYSRRNCIVVHGIPETPKEDCVSKAIELFKSKLDVDIHPDQIDRAHRLGKTKDSRKMSEVVSEGRRAIIVKFTSYKFRHMVFTQKKRLKGTKILITESLTRLRISLVQEASKIYQRVYF